MDSNEAEKCINGQCAMERKYKDQIGHIQKMLHSWWNRKMAYPVRNIDDCVKHTFSERPTIGEIQQTEQ